MSVSAESEAGVGQGVTMEVEDGVAMIRIDQPGRPVNVLSAGLVEELTAVIGELETGPARAAVILSGKPGVWIAGADIEEFGSLETAADGEALSRTAHKLLGRLEALRIPVVAAMDGVALGGGLEMALACGYRVATDSPKTKLGLPEVQLGLLPGAGGTQRLPRLVGLRAALDLMLTGKQLDARRARKIGLVDEVVPAALLLRVARDAAVGLAEGRLRPRAARASGSPQWIENLPGLRQFILRKARDEVMGRTHGLYPAPLRILDVAGRGLDLSLADGLELEARAFGELSVTPESRALVHVFFVSTAARNESGMPEDAVAREVERVAVVGAGFMGAGIAVVAAESGERVRLKDVTAEAAAKGLDTALSSLRERAARRHRKPFEITALADRVEAGLTYDGFSSTDLVVEAVFEDVPLKHRVLREIEEASGPDTVLGTNTSTIPIHILAEGVEHPERIIGLHFFSPVEKMPLLEIIITPTTDPSVAATAHRWAKRIGKTPVIVNDAPGFYVNRILGPYMNEAALLLEEGVPMTEVDTAMVKWGFPVGPITLFDEVGLDVAAKSGMILQEAFGDRIPGNALVQKLVDDGRRGRKNGRGFYRYEGRKRAGPDPSVAPLAGFAAERSLPAEEIQERLVLGMLNEAVRCLEDGVLRSARDGDVGAVMGIGFPPFRGGPFWYIDRAGPGAVLERIRTLESRFGARFAPAPLLERKAESGERFSEER
jgi:3-hydroxyacyl-CoA dehydrogenase/enoyl-CoA hydratase/3-hydroxybutyryl-CoA epimerase